MPIQSRPLGWYITTPIKHPRDTAIFPLVAAFPEGRPLHFGELKVSTTTGGSETLYDKNVRLYHTLQPELFAPKPSAPGQNRFAVIGDPGSGDSHQWAIAQQLIQAYEKAPFGSVLVLGDNVYEDGEPHLFKERMYDPYAPLFEKGVKFYPILGNHDVRKGFQDQQLQLWGAPEFYSFTLANNTVEIFAIDTTVFLPFIDQARSYNPTLAYKKAEIERVWLETALAKSKAQTKIVIGHYPIFSSGEHANKEKAYVNLRNILQPMFEKYGVSLYLSGHEHHYERSAPIGGVTHIVSGSAGKLLATPWPAPTDYPREKHIPRFQMMVFEAQLDGHLTYETRSDQGDLLDCGTISTQDPKPQLTLTKPLSTASVLSQLA